MVEMFNRDMQGMKSTGTKASEGMQEMKYEK